MLKNTETVNIIHCREIDILKHFMLCFKPIVSCCIIKWNEKYKAKQNRTGFHHLRLFFTGLERLLSLVKWCAGAGRHPAQEWRTCTSLPNSVKWPHVESLKLAVMGVFTAWKLAGTRHQGFGFQRAILPAHHWFLSTYILPKEVNNRLFLEYSLSLSLLVNI